MWLAGTERKTCKDCQWLYDEYKQEGYDVEPPCGTCFPTPHPYNRATFDVYIECSDQIIFSPGGAVGLNIPAVEIVLNDYDIPNKNHRRQIRNDVRQLAQKVISHQHKAAERRRKK